MPNGLSFMSGSFGLDTPRVPLLIPFQHNNTDHENSVYESVVVVIQYHRILISQSVSQPLDPRIIENRHKDPTLDTVKGLTKSIKLFYPSGCI